MFGRERRSQTYRVYAEDDFLGVEDAGLADAGFGDAGLADAGLGDAGLGDTDLGDMEASGDGDIGGFGDAVADRNGRSGASLYTAPPRVLPGPLQGRLTVVLVALVAMALSALVVHLLRASLAGGEAAPRPSLTAAGPPASPRVAPRRVTPSAVAARGGVDTPGGVAARAGTSAPSGIAARAGMSAPSSVASRAKASVSGGTTRNDSPHTRGAFTEAVGATPPSSTESAGMVAAAPASEIAAAVPEFGFERPPR